MTAVEKYIVALKNFKKINGTIDDAIVVAETLLLSLEQMEKERLLLSDEEIQKGAEINTCYMDDFIKGAKWYRETLKTKMND